MQEKILVSNHGNNDTWFTISDYCTEYSVSCPERNQLEINQLLFGGLSVSNFNLVRLSDNKISIGDLVDVLHAI